MKKTILQHVLMMSTVCLFFSCEEAELTQLEPEISTAEVQFANTASEIQAVQANFSAPTTATSNDVSRRDFEKKLIDWREKVDFAETKDFAPTRISRDLDKKALKKFLKAQENEIQIRTFEPDAETSITLKEGTLIHVPTNAFTFEDGSNVTTPVTLQVQEYYELEDMVLAGLNTNADDQILESGGMLNIEAFSKGKPLKIREQKELDIHMPIKDEYKEDMELYHSKRGRMYRHNWKLFMGGRKRNHKPRKYRFSRELLLTKSTTSIVNDNNETMITDEFSHAAAKEMYLFGKKGVVQTLLTFDRNGRMIDNRITEKEGALEWSRVNVFKSRKRRYRSFVEYPIREKPNGQKGRFVVEIRKAAMSCFKEFNSKYIRELYRKHDISKKKHLQILLEQELVYGKGITKKMAMHRNGVSIDELQADEISREKYYRFGVTKTGFINCDRLFKPLKARINIEVAVNEDIVDMTMSLDNSKVILKGVRKKNKMIFYKVPVNSSFKVVAVKSEGGKIYSGSFRSRAAKRKFKYDFQYTRVHQPSFRTSIKNTLNE